MNHWTTWDAWTKASVWVAFGTLALAVVTVVSVLETRSVSSRRGSTASAELCNEVSGLESASDEPFGVFALTNRSNGLANQIRVTAKLTLYFVVLRGDIARESSEDVTYDGTISQVAPSEKVFINLLSQAAKRDNRRIAVHAVSLAYEDMFGNEYTTAYSDWERNEYNFVWRQPDSLKGIISAPKTQ